MLKELLGNLTKQQNQPTTLSNLRSQLRNASQNQKVKIVYNGRRMVIR